MTQPRNIVVYLEFGPTFAAREGLRAAAAEATLLNEIGRPERFALVAAGTDRAPLDAATAAGLIAPADERIGEPVSVGQARAAGPETLHVLAHVDVVPFNLEAVNGWLEAQADAARAEGALQYEVWRQADRPNHFTVIQAWADQDAWARHVESAATRGFRAKLMTLKGALYDERLYRRVD